MPLENLQKAYDALSQKYDVGTFDDFKTGMQDSSKQRKAYDALSQDYDIGDFDTFRSDTSIEPQTATPTATPPPIPEQAQKVEQSNPDADLPPIIRSARAGIRMAESAALKGYAMLADLQPESMPGSAAVKERGARDKKAALYMAKRLDEGAAQSSYMQERWGSKGENLWSVVKRGDAKETLEYIAHGAVTSAPSSLVALIPYVGLPAVGLMAAGEAYTGAREEGIVDKNTAALNAAFEGAAELVFEKLGTKGIYDAAKKSLAESVGKRSAVKIIKEIIYDAFLKEPASEAATSIVQDYSRAGTGVDPNALEGMVGRAGEAAVLAVPMGAGVSVAGSVQGGIQRKALRNMLHDNILVDTALRSGIDPESVEANLRDRAKTESTAPFSRAERDVLNPAMKELRETIPAFSHLSIKEQRAAARSLLSEALGRPNEDDAEFDRVTAIMDHLGIKYRPLTPNESLKVVKEDGKRRLFIIDTKGKHFRGTISFNADGTVKVIATAPRAVTIAHELGHYVVVKAADGIDLNSLDAAELHAVYNEYIAKFQEVIPKRSWTGRFKRGQLSAYDFGRINPRGEAVADFISMYLMNPEKAQKLAPKLYATLAPLIEKHLELNKVTPVSTVAEVEKNIIRDVVPTSATPNEVLAKYGMKDEGRMEGHIQFSDPVTGNTMYIPEDEFSEMAVVDALIANINKDWAYRGITPEQSVQLQNKYIDIYRGTAEKQQRKFNEESEEYRKAHPEETPAAEEPAAGVPAVGAQTATTPVTTAERKPAVAPEKVEDITGANAEMAEGPTPPYRRMFGLAKARGVSVNSLLSAIEEITGVKEPKFTGSGENVVPESVIKEVNDRLNHIGKNWTDVEKRHYIIHGERQMPDLSAAVAARMRTENPIGNALKSLAANFTQSITTTLKKMGPVGEEIARRYEKQQHYRDSKYGSTMWAIENATKHFSDADWEAVIRARNNGAGTVGLTAKQLNAYNIIVSNLNQIDAMAKKLQFKTTRLSDGKKAPYAGISETYWPHMFEFDMLRNEQKRKRFIDNMVKDGKITRDEALRRLEQMIEQRTRNLAPNIEYAREFYVPGWLGDPNSEGFSGKKAYEGLARYFASVYTRISEAAFYDYNGKHINGPDHQSVIELIHSEEDPIKRAMMSKAMKTIRGLNPADVERPFLAALRNLQVVKLLGLSGIPNMFQLSTTATSKAFQFGALRGMKILYRGLKEAVTNPDFARYEVGASMMQNMREITGAGTTGVTGKAATIAMHLYGMSAQERVNNIVAASVGKSYIKEAMDIANGASPTRVFGVKVSNKSSTWLRRQATAELMKFGVSAESIKSGHLTDNEISFAAWKMARMTQFGGGPGEVPLFWSTEYGKTLFQFRRFTFGMSKLMYNEVLKPAIKHGNFMPMIGVAVPGLIAGEAVNLLRNVILGGEDRPDDVLERLWEDISAVGILGVFIDAYNATAFGRIPETLIGPTIGGAAEFIDYVRRGEIREALRRQIPVVRSVGRLKPDRKTKHE
jgi:hypothetical protein